MKQVTATTQLRYYKELVVDTKDVIKPNDVIMSPKLTQDIDLLLQLGDVLGVIAQHDAFAGELFPFTRATILMSFWFTPRGNTDLTVGSLSNNQVSVQKIGWPTLRRVQAIADMVLCRRVVGDSRGRKRWLNIFRIWRSRVLVKGR